MPTYAEQMQRQEIKGYFDPCHYNSSSLEICHYYSCIWTHAITILLLLKICHCVHIRYTRAHVQRMYRSVVSVFTKMPPPSLSLTAWAHTSYSSSSSSLPCLCTSGVEELVRRQRGEARAPASSVRRSGAGRRRHLCLPVRRLSSSPPPQRHQARAQIPTAAASSSAGAGATAVLGRGHGRRRRRELVRASRPLRRPASRRRR